MEEVQHANAQAVTDFLLSLQDPALKRAKALKAPLMYFDQLSMFTHAPNIRRLLKQLKFQFTRNLNKEKRYS